MVLTIREVEEISALEDEFSEGQDENNALTVVNPNVGELPLFKRSLYVTKTPYEEIEGRKSQL